VIVAMCVLQTLKNIIKILYF